MVVMRHVWTLYRCCATVLEAAEPACLQASAAARVLASDYRSKPEQWELLTAGQLCIPIASWSAAVCCSSLQQQRCVNPGWLYTSRYIHPAIMLMLHMIVESAKHKTQMLVAVSEGILQKHASFFFFLVGGGGGGGGGSWYMFIRVHVDHPKVSVVGHDCSRLLFHSSCMQDGHVNSAQAFQNVACLPKVDNRTI